MAKRKRKQNIEKMIKEGYGSGIGSEYKPWIKIQDLPSLGRVTRVKGIKTNRQHELLSDMERNYFYILEYSDNVKDINKTIAHNISFIQGYRDIKNVDGFTDLDSLEIQDLIYEFIRRIVDDKRSIRAISLEFDNGMSLESGCGLSIFKYLVINKIIEIDISKNIDVNKNIPILSVSRDEIKKVEAI